MVPESDSVIHVGDSLRLVGPRTKLSQFETVIGRKSRVNLGDISNEIGVERLLVTKKEVLGKSLGALTLSITTERSERGWTEPVYSSQRPTLLICNSEICLLS